MQRTPPRIAFRRPWPGTRRGLKLWIISVIIGLKGFGYLVNGGPPSTDAALELPLKAFPLEVWGGVIVTLCSIALFCSYCHFGRDQYGYKVIVGFCFGWTFCYLFAGIFLDGPPVAFQGALSYTLIAIFTLISAGDPDPIIPGEDAA